MIEMTISKGTKSQGITKGFLFKADKMDDQCILQSRTQEMKSLPLKLLTSTLSA